MRPAALVTGSAKGIGRRLLLALAEDGFDVVVHYRGSESAAREVADEARVFGVAAEVLQADVTVQAEAEALVDRSVARFGRLDVVVNNVGNYHKGPLAELDAGAWHEMLDSNLNATFYVCQRSLPALRRSPRGRIVNVGYAGSDALVAKPGIVAYQIAKTGVLLYTRALAKSEARHGLTANVLAPGVIENSVTQPIEEIPMDRPGTLDEMAAAARYLVSEEARYVTGAYLPVAGGWNL
jgi:NAD(P)-dependent dehydrogenase (short-subunit alcohol dehydrogenase family)